MEFQLNITVNLGSETINAITKILTGAAPAAAKPVEAPAKAAAKPVEAPAKPAATAPAAKPAAKKTDVDFEGLDEDAQLEAIKSEVTRHTKKGKSADIKALLAFYGAARASELDTDKYLPFYETILRYGKGESVEDLTAEDLD